MNAERFHRIAPRREVERFVYGDDPQTTIVSHRERLIISVQIASGSGIADRRLDDAGKEVFGASAGKIE